MKRHTLLEYIAGRIAKIARPHPVRVGIDGVDGVGKTTFADELIAPLKSLGHAVIRASIDGFHNPRSVRYAQGRESPEGFFRDSFNLEAFVECVLAPLGPHGSRRYRRALFDYRSDREISVDEEMAEPSAIILVDAIFLHQPRLRPYWDFSVFLDAPFEITVARTAARGGGSADPKALSNRRYVEGQRIYLRECTPQKWADVVIDNSALDDPRIVKGDT